MTIKIEQWEFAESMSAGKFGKLLELQELQNNPQKFLNQGKNAIKIFVDFLEGLRKTGPKITMEIDIVKLFTLTMEYFEAFLSNTGLQQKASEMQSKIRSK
jgi:hypothetical protein